MLQSEETNFSLTENLKFPFAAIYHWNFWNKFVNFSFSSSPFAAKSLTCYCNIYCPDDSDKCETKPGGYCFASVRGTYNSTFNGYDTERDYGCMPPEQHGGLLQVSFTNIKKVFFVMKFNLIQLDYCCDFSAVDHLMWLDRISFAATPICVIMTWK